jgi:7-cyano-7-deazaguanine synthase
VGIGGKRMNEALLLSGGLDSTALAFWKRPALAITLDYGQQPADAEIEASKAVCAAIKVKHVVLRVDCSELGSGTLAGIPAHAAAPAPEWWPYRNQLLVTLAAATAFQAQADRLLIGTLRTDGFHADGTQKFIEAMSAVLAMQEGGLQLSAPAIDMTSAELVRKSGIPRSILAWAHSCHVGNYACGRCRGCAKHQATLTELGLA